LRRKGILALAVVALLALGAGVAFATTKYSTKIDYLGNGSHGIKDVTLFGDLEANGKCVGAREMGLFRKTSKGYKLVDVDLSSYNGAWALRGDLTGSPDLAVKAKKDTRKGGGVLCKSATITLTPNSANYPRVR